MERKKKELKERHTNRTLNERNRSKESDNKILKKK